MLYALINAIVGQVCLSVDARFALPENLNKDVDVNRVSPSIWSRLLAEISLYNNVQDSNYVLCFGNLPPLFKLRGYTVLFLQNRYLIEENSLRDFPLKIRFRLYIERFWIRRRLANVDKFVVQTPTMKRLLEAKFKRITSIQVLPFVAESKGYVRGFQNFNINPSSIFDFVYVASGEPHKNHRCLIEAWRLLAGEGLYPSLCLTVDEGRFPEVCYLINEMRQMYGVRIFNMGTLAHLDILGIYGNSRAVIYPSKFESFGLPLIEARQAGLPVIASELDFVRDVLDPEQVFDANSPISIARAVKRFLGKPESPLPLLDAAQFLAAIGEKDFL